MRHLIPLTLAIIVSTLLAGCAAVPPAPAPVQWSDDVDHERLIVVTIRNERPTLVPRAGSTTRSYSGRSAYAAAPATLAQSRSIATTYKLREVSGWPIGLLGVHCLVYELAPGSDREAMLERLRRDRRVESAQPLNSFRTLTGTQADPYRKLQRNLDLMNVSRAHRWSRGEGVRIGIIDTGVDVQHPELEGKIATYRDFVAASRAPSPDAHGTAVAGLIVAGDRNALGIVGIAPASRLYALRACWPEPNNGFGARCNTLTLAKALIAALDAKVNVINLSLGGPADPLLARIVQTGLERGVVFVGAAPSITQDRFPTSIEGVIAVDALGRTHTADALVFAPGTDVLTLAPNGSYDFLSGSSLAAASISAGIALILARQPNLTSEQIKALLTLSARGRSDEAHSARSVDLCAAIASLVNRGSCD